ATPEAARPYYRHGLAAARRAGQRRRAGVRPQAGGRVRYAQADPLQHLSSLGGDLSNALQSWWQQALAKANDGGRWRSLEELVATPELKAAWESEFAPGVDSPDGLSRRGFLHLLGASLGLAGVAGCAQQPTEKILPYTVPPAHV